MNKFTVTIQVEGFDDSKVENIIQWIKSSNLSEDPDFFGINKFNFIVENK